MYVGANRTEAENVRCGLLFDVFASNYVRRENVSVYKQPISYRVQS